MDISQLGNEELVKLHTLAEEGMTSKAECGYSFTDLDDELHHRVDEGMMDWPY